MRKTRNSTPSSPCARRDGGRVGRGWPGNWWSMGIRPRSRCDPGGRGRRRAGTASPGSGAGPRGPRLLERRRLRPVPRPRTSLVRRLRQMAGRRGDPGDPRRRRRSPRWPTRSGTRTSTLSFARSRPWASERSRCFIPITGPTRSAASPRSPGSSRSPRRRAATFTGRPRAESGPAPSSGTTACSKRCWHGGCKRRLRSYGICRLRRHRPAARPPPPPPPPPCGLDRRPDPSLAAAPAARGSSPVGDSPRRVHAPPLRSPTLLLGWAREPDDLRGAVEATCGPGAPFQESAVRSGSDRDISDMVSGSRRFNGAAENSTLAEKKNLLRERRAGETEHACGNPQEPIDAAGKRGNRIPPNSPMLEELTVAEEDSLRTWTPSAPFSARSFSTPPRSLSFVPILTRENFSPTHTGASAPRAELSERTAEIDVLTLKEELDHTGAVEKAGGSSYLTALLDGIPRRRRRRALRPDREGKVDAAAS